jgi:hypothetical protein
MSKPRTYFISHAGANWRWAELIASVVKDAGHEAIHQEQHFTVGASFSHKMMIAAGSDCTIVVMSPAYFRSEHCMAELHAALTDDPLGLRSRIFPVLVAPCKLPRLVDQLAYVDRQGVDEETTRQRIRNALLKERKVEPATSGASRARSSPGLRGRLWRTGLTMGALAVMGAAGVLLIPWGGAPRGRAPVSASASTSGATPPTQVSRAVRIESLEVDDYRDGPTQHGGTIGVLAHAARFDDNVRVSARLSAPGYCYLIALNPDGTVQVCPKDQEKVPPSRTSEIVFPGAADDYYALTDGPGLQAFVLVASRTPLPSFESWPARAGLPWSSTSEGEAWQFDGRDFDFLGSATKHNPADRGEVRHVKTAAPTPFVAVCNYLKQLPGVDAIRATAFPVLPTGAPKASAPPTP